VVHRRIALGSAATLVALACGVAPASAAPSGGDGCSFAKGVTTCVTATSEVTTVSAPDGVDGTRVSAGRTVWGNACLEFVPSTWYYGAFNGTSIQETVTTTTTTTYRGRTARHDKKISTDTVVGPPTHRVTEGEIFCYGARLNPYRFEAPYPS
jgi:hypothetical protein